MRSNSPRFVYASMRSRRTGHSSPPPATRFRCCVTLLEAAVNGEDQILVSAINVAETRLAHPFELILERRRAIEFHPLERGREVAIIDTQFAHSRQPSLVMELVPLGSRAPKLLGVDEHAVGVERAVDSPEERALLLIAQVMDRQRRNNRV